MGYLIDSTSKIVLHIPCQDIYHDKSLCQKSKILFYNPNQLKDLKKLCYSDLIYRKTPKKTSYVPDMVVEYLHVNGINANFLNDLFRYQTKITNGIVDIF